MSECHLAQCHHILTQKGIIHDIRKVAARIAVFTRDTAADLDYCRTMFRKGFLIVWLLAVSLIATTTVHAQEIPGLTTLECSGAVHVEPEKDSKPASGEPDKGTAHHHGCHSASTFIAGSADAEAVFELPSRAYSLLDVTALLRRVSGPGLRPPIV